MRKTREFPPIFVTPRKMREQILDGFDLETSEWCEFRSRYPFQIGERLRKFHHDSIGPALRIAWM